MKVSTSSMHTVISSHDMLMTTDEGIPYKKLVLVFYFQRELIGKQHGSSHTH